MHLKTFLARLVELAEHSPPDCDVIINGEQVCELELALNNPLAEIAGRSGMRELRADTLRPRQFNISTNGRKARSMPVRKIGF